MACSIRGEVVLQNFSVVALLTVIRTEFPIRTEFVIRLVHHAVSE